jgi:GxxExxY protein
LIAVGSGMRSCQTIEDPQTYAIIGAAMEVHRELGDGFVEVVYREALLWELDRRSIPLRTEVSLPVYFKRHRLPCTFRADLICFDDIVVELKAIQKIAPSIAAQVINYLKASRLSRGLILNFGGASLEYRRLTNPGTGSTGFDGI